jgi:hypothetical protein
MAKAKGVKRISYKKVVDGFHQVLHDSNLGHLRVHSVTLVPSGAKAKDVGGCPPGYEPKQVCVPTSDGGVYCYTTCVPSGRQS